MFLTMCVLCGMAATPVIPFEMIEITPNTGVVPAVALADVDGDKDLDLLAMSNDDIAWYENPAWERHLISPVIQGLNVYMAAADINGDGLPEIAAGADWQFGNTKSGGALYVLVRSGDVKAPWQRAQILAEPTIHRVRWADADGDGKPELYVAPLMGRNSTEPDYKEAGVRLMALRPPADLLKDPWPMEVVNESQHILHSLMPFHAMSGSDYILTASFEGITLHGIGPKNTWASVLLTSGSPQPWPKSGCSEIKIGQLAQDRSVMATIEPWHGNQVVVYTHDAPGPVEATGDWSRHVIDETFNQGHALGWGDFDGDGHDELVAGYREPSPATQRVGLNLYRFTGADPVKDLAVEKQVLDDGGIAAEDLAIGDVNNDGKPDILVGGRSTHNLRLYLNRHTP